MALVLRAAAEAGYPYKQYFLAVELGVILWCLRRLLAKRDGTHRELTPEAKRDWVRLIEYNREDVMGMRYLTDYVQQGLGGFGRPFD